MKYCTREQSIQQNKLDCERTNTSEENEKSVGRKCKTRAPLGGELCARKFFLK